MQRALVWFRRDLRLNDHTALHQALQLARQVHAVFVFDRDILDALPERADMRVTFIRDCVVELQAALGEYGAGLHVLHGSARELIPELAARLQVDGVFAARDYEPFARERDAAVQARLAKDGRSLTLVKDQVIFDTDELLTANATPFHVFTPYRNAWLKRLATHAALPRLLPHDVSARLAPAPPSLPSLQDLGFFEQKSAVAAGERAAQAALDDFLTRIDAYRATRDYPALKGPSYLSAHLRFGTLSIRTLVQHALQHSSEGADTWLGELIWREFYQMLLWHYPHTVDQAFQSRHGSLVWPNPPGHFEAWCEARTGYPIVDAAMRQLNQSGYMHNRLRMIAASFLVKDLHVDWRQGERHFAAKLLDFDLAANVGGWQWSASVGTDAQPWFRIFNPVTQSEKFDPQGRFIRRYLPELASVPEQFIHAPWRMTAAQQADCKVLIGRDYPAPVVDHAQARLVTLALFDAGRSGH